VVEQRLDFGPYLRIFRDAVREPADDIGRLVLERGLEQFSGAPMLLGSHVLSSRKSQARARLQRRFNVAGEMSMASAASSTLSPAK